MPPIDRDEDEPKAEGSSRSKSNLILDAMVRLPAPVLTSLGTMYLYAPRLSDLSALSSLPNSTSSARLRQFLPKIASLIEVRKFREKRPALTAEYVTQLTEEDLEHLAGVYVANHLGAQAESHQGAVLPSRDEGESAVQYMDRLLQFKAKEFAQWAKASSEKLLASTSGMFAKVRSSAAALGETLGEFEALESSAPRLEMRTPDLSDTFREMQEFHRRQALERAEELQMVRLTGRMTAESARTLKDLAEAATELLDKWGERDEKADRATRKQLNIAVFSVVVSAVLALVAVIMSGLGLRQDGINNAAAERSQAELISAVKESGLQREAAELEALGLRRKIDDLEEKIAHLESLASAPQKSPEPGSGQSATSKPARQKP